MTNTIAIVLGVLLVGLIAADLLIYDWGAVLFLARKAAALSEWLAFWR